MGVAPDGEIGEKQERQYLEGERRMGKARREGHVGWETKNKPNIESNKNDSFVRFFYLLI